MDKLYSNLPEPNFSENALTILNRRYLHRDDTGKVIENPKDMLYRVAKTIAQVELKYGLPKKDVDVWTRDFYNIMANGYFLPNSPTLRGAGINSNLAACFVLPISDSRKSIFKTLQDAVEIQAFGGGTGFSFSELRPDGSIIQSTKGTSRGPLPFIDIYDKVIGEVIAQGGVRQGANMGILNYNHPNIMQFIRYKSTLNDKNAKVVQDYINESGLDPNSDEVKILENILIRNLQLSNFNLSVGVTEEFMKMAREGKDYDLINHKGQVVGKLNAKQVLDEIVQGAWRTGDPGIIYLDRIDRDNPTPALGKIVSTNPCGEQPLLPYEACNLGSINLAKMVNDKGINYDLLEKVTDSAVRFLDNVIDANTYVVPEIETMTKGNRKIGLGVMGFADMLIQLNIPYNSSEGLDVAEKVMRFVNDKARESSKDIAKVKGSFPNIEKSIYKEPIRNATRTTIAPTGTISTLLDASSGIEPIYALYYVRSSIYDAKGKPTEQLVTANPYLEKVLVANKIDFKKVVEYIKKEGTIQGAPGVPEEIQNLFLTANEIPVEQHLKMQSAFQKHVDNAVSKTINLKAEATIEDVANAYWLSYDLKNIKGLTVYRDKSKGPQVLTTIRQDSRSLDDVLSENLRRGRDVPGIRWLPGATFQAKTGCGSLFVTVNRDKYGPVEIFNNMNPPGGCSSAQTASSGINISLGLHKNVDPRTVIKHNKAVGCPRRNELVGEMSCPQAASLVMEEFMEISKLLPNNYFDKFYEAVEKYRRMKEEKTNGKEAPVVLNNKSGLNLVDALCPECKSPLQFGEGCKGGKCANCGYSNCG
ncbi:MAG: adenosylcobalamin-dependent ribonucleoside-diphosphate reductase [Candidatus Nanoarchaeia archaeon]